MTFWRRWVFPSARRARNAPSSACASCIAAWRSPVWKNQPARKMTRTHSECGGRIEGRNKEKKGNYMRLNNQVAIVTGVSHPGQIGFALADAFAREGARLVISARNAERVQARAQEMQAKGAKVIGVPADLTSEEGAHSLIARTVETYGRVDILVNLAGGLTQVQPS